LAAFHGFAHNPHQGYQMDASQEVRQSDQEVVVAPASSLADAVNKFIGQFVGSPLHGGARLCR
jgi:hypothetical protein